MINANFITGLNDPWGARDVWQQSLHGELRRQYGWGGGDSAETLKYSCSLLLRARQPGGVIQLLFTSIQLTSGGPVKKASAFVRRVLGLTLTNDVGLVIPSLDQRIFLVERIFRL
jgi:hypothetical protein